MVEMWKHLFGSLETQELIAHKDGSKVTHDNAS